MTVSVLFLFHMVRRVGLQCVIVVFSGHTHLNFCNFAIMYLYKEIKFKQTYIGNSEQIIFNYTCKKK